MAHIKRIAIVVGETSGDILGAGLMRALRERLPDCQFEGIGGPRMCAEGFNSLFPLERLAVMGLVDPLKRLPELLSMRKQLRKRFIADPPDVFIGVDAPDFNLNLELSLREAGVLTAHYVSPSVWAWRQNRIHKIKRAVDLMLTLFPFESRFYEDAGVPVTFVGHPLANELPLEPDKLAARARLGLPEEGEVVALLPGSRGGEVQHIAPCFLKAAAIVAGQRPAVRFLLPAANASRLSQLQALLEAFPDLPVTLIDGDSHSAMEAADAVMIASGTATLEAMLLKRPMVIAYKMAGWAFWVFSRLVKVRRVGLPNLLAGRDLVPELLQTEATAEAVAAQTLNWLQQPERSRALQEEFHRLHLQLRRDASEVAADALVSLMAERRQKESQRDKR